MFWITILLGLFSGLICLAQTTLQLPGNFKQSYRDHVREANGAPGYKYWQNRADYSIDVQFDPGTRRLSGRLSLDYFNNSPDTLSRIVFKLYPNLYKTDAIRAKSIARDDLGNGVQIDSLLINGETIDGRRITIRGTNMLVRDVNLLPASKTHVSIQYSYYLNKGSFIRTGQVDSGAFVIAYFFPRITVYDDIDGWNEYPYTGFDEFYNDYGDFHIEIAVPDDYQVWCTGNLTNASSVLNDKYLKALQYATSEDGVVDVITQEDVINDASHKKGTYKTWVFDARNVPDVSFMTSNHYIWKSSSVLVDSSLNRRVRVDAVYNPAHRQYDPVINYSRATVSAISYTFPKLPFPYPHITIFEGLDAMEYPMMVNTLAFTEPSEIVELTAHEVFHTLFPFYVGTNETKYSFMDEGLATLSEFTLHPIIAPHIPVRYSIEEVNETAGTDFDNPIMTLTPQLNSKSRFVNKDLKPALGFHYVKEMLGDEMFSKAMLHFINNWAGKHPTPYDLFNCFNSEAGVNLNWFWNEWFVNRIAPDLAITKVIRSGSRYRIVIKKIGAGSVPVHLDITFSDGSHFRLSKDISCWSQGKDSVSVKLKSRKTIKQVKLGDSFDIDIDKSNNLWNIAN